MKAYPIYVTYKYNQGHSHILDEFDTLTEAIASAKSLHHPDWPIYQGITVVRFNCENHQGELQFDSQKDK